eukprot:scaffold529777_cov55-Prasinocladus_malaysianus.AAC.1
MKRMVISYMPPLNDGPPSKEDSWNRLRTNDAGRDRRTPNCGAKALLHRQGQSQIQALTMSDPTKMYKKRQIMTKITPPDIGIS